MINTIPKRFNLSYVEEFFEKQPFTEGEKKYASFHKYRYLYLLDIVAHLKEEFGDETLNVLDVGPRFQTNLLREAFSNINVNSLGFDWPGNTKNANEYHIKVDLNETQEVDITGYPKNQIIIYAEVLEHLYTMPSITLKYFKGILDNGGYVVMQTPNGVSLDRRLRMLIGQNPYQLIKPHRMNHYREYTLSELQKITVESGYVEMYSSRKNYFDPNNTFFQRLNRRLEMIMPPSLRSGLTMIIKNE